MDNGIRRSAVPEPDPAGLEELRRLYAWAFTLHRMTGDITVPIPSLRQWQSGRIRRNSATLIYDLRREYQTLVAEGLLTPLTEGN